MPLFLVMPKVTFDKAYKFAEFGHTVVEYEPGEHEVSEQCADRAAQDGVLKKAPVRNKATKPASNKGTK